jgi:protein gp37
LWRVDHLLNAPAVVHGVSLEPLLGPITLPEKFMKSANAWVLAGGEATIRKGCRYAHPDWFRSLRDQCQSAGVAFFFKQWGSFNEQFIRIGKHEAGRVLDGREWSEIPL